jgi:hypothetical protein
MDVWNLLYDFAKIDIATFDPQGIFTSDFAIYFPFSHRDCWPVMLDDFVQWYNEQPKK